MIVVVCLRRTLKATGICVISRVVRELYRRLDLKMQHFGHHPMHGCFRASAAGLMGCRSLNENERQRAAYAGRWTVLGAEEYSSLFHDIDIIPRSPKYRNVCFTDRIDCF